MSTNGTQLTIRTRSRKRGKRKKNNKKNKNNLNDNLNEKQCINDIMDFMHNYTNKAWYRGKIHNINKSEIKILIYKHELPLNIRNTWIEPKKEIITIKKKDKSLKNRIRPINTKTIRLYKLNSIQPDLFANIKKMISY